MSGGGVKILVLPVSPRHWLFHAWQVQPSLNPVPVSRLSSWQSQAHTPQHVHQSCLTCCWEQAGPVPGSAGRLRWRDGVNLEEKLSIAFDNTGAWVCGLSNQPFFRLTRGLTCLRLVFRAWS